MYLNIDLIFGQTNPMLLIFLYFLFMDFLFLIIIYSYINELSHTIMIPRRYDYKINSTIPETYHLADNKDIFNDQYSKKYSNQATSSPIRTRQTLNISLNEEKPQFNTFSKYHYDGYPSIKYNTLNQNQNKQQINMDSATKNNNSDKEFQKTRKFSNIEINQRKSPIVRNVKKHDCLDRESSKTIQNIQNRQIKQAKLTKQRQNYSFNQYQGQQQKNKFQRPFAKAFRNEHNYVENINQKDIVEKVGRINNLNEQINCRLQRMLQKIHQI